MNYSINPKTSIIMYDHEKTAQIVTSREDFKHSLNVFAADYPELCRLEELDLLGNARYTVAQNAILLTVAHPQMVNDLAELFE